MKKLMFLLAAAALFAACSPDAEGINDDPKQEEPGEPGKPDDPGEDPENPDEPENPDDPGEDPENPDDPDNPGEDPEDKPWWEDMQQWGEFSWNFNVEQLPILQYLLEWTNLHVRVFGERQEDEDGMPVYRIYGNRGTIIKPRKNDPEQKALVPQFGIRKVDDTYYYTLNGELLLDPATDDAPVDGIGGSKPSLTIKDGYWYVYYNWDHWLLNPEKYVPIEEAPKTKPDGSYSIVEEITERPETWDIRLADGETTLSFFKSGGLTLTLDAENELLFFPTETQTIHYAIAGCSPNTVVSTSVKDHYSQEAYAYDVKVIPSNDRNGSIEISARNPTQYWHTLSVKVEDKSALESATAKITLRINPAIEEHTIEVAQPGTLSQYLVGYRGIKRLTISGYLNQDDLRTLNSLSALAELDLEQVHMEVLPSHSFRDNVSLVSIKLPATLTTIESFAFSKCSKLADITIPEGVTTIEEFAFSGCTALTDLTLPASITSIGNYAFSGCNRLHITLAEGTTAIWDNMFKGYSELTAITIPESVTSIGDYAFNRCTGLTDITIPGSVRTIGKECFSNCSNLTTVTLEEGVSAIGESAFWYCSNLTDIVFPESVTSIEAGAFQDCSNLSRVQLPKNITTIALCTFFDCHALTEITIPENVTTIGEAAFSRCFALTRVTMLAEGMTTIEKQAFYDCGALTDIVFSRNGVSVGDSAFYFCSVLKNATGQVRSVGDGAFRSCKELTSITLAEGITAIGNNAFASCTQLTDITIPGTVTAIGDHAFDQCSGLTAITIPESVTSIGEASFWSCANLKTVTLEEGLTSIGESAFRYCKISSITLPRSIVSIGDQAFNISSLTSIYCKAPEPPVVDANTFTDWFSLHVPIGCAEAYSTNWGISLSRIYEMEF